MARCIIAGAVVTYALAVFQNTLGGFMTIWGVTPDLLLVWTICMGLLGGRHVGALVGFASGLMQGGLQQAAIGAYAISKTVSGFGAGVLAGKMFRENWLVPIVSAGVLTAVNEAAFLVLYRAADWSQAGRVVGLRVAYHAVLTPVVFAVAGRARRALLGRPEKVL
ncbi:MAG: rod shape-determining protein MreD [Armatimonadota bacterium]|nr:MAG: rod shape-determining protein MreD [Armatimonadota bacterium]